MQLNATFSDERLYQFRASLRVLEREIGNQLKDETVCCGVTPAQCHTLLEIDQRCCVSVSELAEAFGQDRSTMSRSIDSLVHSGLARRIENSTDRRVLDITLTEKGKTLASTINSSCNDSYRKLFRFIPEEKHEQIIEAFTIFAGALGSYRKETRTRGCCNSEA